ncbi:MAG: hypothetical protein H6696_14815 [Deferribacteres bacterium]|nr:hypothetical protein [Deferribacteres bacterium]
MALYYNMQRNPGAFVRHHWLHTKTGDGKELITVSGITAIHVKGQTHQRWYRETVNMNIDLTHMVPDWPLEDGSSAKSWIKLTNWVPFVTINAIYDRAHSVDAGFAVDEFSLGVGRPIAGTDIPYDFYLPSMEPAISNSVDMRLVARIAVRDSDAYLYRIGYHVTLTGEFVQPYPGQLDTGGLGDDYRGRGV